MLSANPVAIGFDIARGVAKAKREDQTRAEVEQTQGLTGFEIFGPDYKQENIGDNMDSGNFFTNLTKGFTSTIGDVANTLANIAGPTNTIARFFGSDTPIIGPTDRNPSVTNTVPRENKDKGISAELRRPVCLFEGGSVAISRRISDRWRLIGAGTVG